MKRTTKESSWVELNKKNNNNKWRKNNYKTQTPKKVETKERRQEVHEHERPPTTKLRIERGERKRRCMNMKD